MTEQSLSFQQDYLKRFYPPDSESREADSFEARLKLMQRFFRLPVTGVLNSRVIEIMQKPRCGVPDIAEYSLFPTRPKWISRVVTYRFVPRARLGKHSQALPLRPNSVFSSATRVVSYTPDLPRVIVNQLVAKALRMWSREIPLSFRRVLVGTADIMIGFARGGEEGRFGRVLRVHASASLCSGLKTFLHMIFTHAIYMTYVTYMHCTPLVYQCRATVPSRGCQMMAREPNLAHHLFL